MKKTFFLTAIMLLNMILFISYAMADTVSGPLSGIYTSSTNIITQGSTTVEPGTAAVLEAPSGIHLSPYFQSNSARFYAIRGQNTDSDSDGLPDAWELLYFGDISTWNGNGDADGDGLTNLQEYNIGTDPTSSDTDNDGMEDGWEVIYGLNPLVDDALDDKDGDGYANYVEFFTGTEPDNEYDFPVQGYYYKYDELNRLTKTIYLPDTQIDLIIEYTYDEVGNRTKKIVQ